MDRTDLLSQILDSLPVFIGLVNEYQVYEFVNATYEERFGRPRQEIIGKTVEELNGTKEYERSRLKIESALRGENVEFEYHYENRTHLIRYQPRIENERVTGYFVISTDITQLKNTASQLEQNQAELKCTRSSFEDFASFTHYDRIASVGAMAVGFTHDISQPISVMNILIDSLRSSIKGTMAEQSTRQTIDSLQAQVQYTADLINRLRRFSAKKAADRRPSDLSQILDDSLAMMRPRIAAKQIELNLDIGDKNAKAIVDPVEIQQVLVNLIVNAIESVSRNAERERLLAVSGRLQAGGVYEYRVGDNGEGVSGEMIEKLFDAFESDKETGIGMGLSISKILVENNGGTLEHVEPSESGAEFVCRIPVIDP